MGGEVGEVCRTGNEGGLRCDYGAPPPRHLCTTYPHSQQNSDCEGDSVVSLRELDKEVSEGEIR